MNNKIDSCLSLDTIFRLSREMRNNGRIIGFTHGAFDLFHIGHLSVLQESRKKCDFLIVGVESDKNISSYKNIFRPIVKEEARLGVINSITHTSIAFVNHLPAENYAYEYLYKEIKPHFVSFGRSFGAESEMNQRGIKLGFEVMRINQGIDESTSAIINSIVQRHYKEADLLKPDTYSNS